ncbi:alpha/beta fold hydrolase BchO [Sphingomonas astaxanthinifaciens]|uniref:Alpha/beta hydrolase n=1 Tax=Sphingomonas astaxanthinifaciens DSM 22298 TaxID=1123267 RepID=A0ABQ5Z4K6_9SPHN|nr:alpha/beta fold hydrolase BchO [Sphingomonas astaxanthinifaciens]GLR47729.1 alpha/beta hydrolase [Sphingomonas astaxanthinifaciens DSM 22298]
MLDFASDGRDWPWREHSRFVEAGGLRWHVQVWGEGPPLLLLHGTGAASHSWRGVAPLLADRFRLVVPDLPGHGFTRGRPRLGLTLDGMAESLGSLIDALEIERPRVAGHSAGAAIACRMAVAEQVAGPITAFCPALLPMGGAAAPLFGSLARMLFLNPVAPHLFTGIARQPGSVARFLERSTGSTLDAEGVALYSRLFADPDHVRGTIEMMSGWRLEGLERALPHMGVPLTIVHGEEDRAIPLADARKAGRLAKARVAVLPGLGHLAHEERPDLAAQAIARAGAQE